ncbi:MAG: enoyl-CoA hydratase/isomerase family protein [Bacteroidales bacterium]|nr:enoyl-CoA hydratase/isomerase family protein [Bacteroidales bacterium]
MEVSREKIWERSGSIGILTLQGPKGNQLEEPAFLPLPLLEEFFGEPGLKGVIIRGSGRHFSAGASLSHLKELASDKAALAEKMDAGKAIIRFIDTTEIPVAAEISGVCFGGGLEIALACHFRICAENALFAFPEINHGLMPGLGGTVMLSRLIGQGRAAGMILSGDTVNAEKAMEMGLADHVVPAPGLHAFTLDFLHKLTDDRDPAVIRSIMRSIHNAREMDTESALAEETRLFCALAVNNFHSG